MTMKMALKALGCVAVNYSLFNYAAEQNVKINKAYEELNVERKSYYRELNTRLPFFYLANPLCKDLSINANSIETSAVKTTSQLK